MNHWGVRVQRIRGRRWQRLAATRPNPVGNAPGHVAKGCRKPLAADGFDILFAELSQRLTGYSLTFEMRFVLRREGLDQDIRIFNRDHTAHHDLAVRPEAMSSALISTRSSVARLPLTLKCPLLSISGALMRSKMGIMYAHGGVWPEMLMASQPGGFMLR